MISTRWLLAFLPAFAFDCASPGFRRGGLTESQLIIEEEVEASRGATAYEVIQRLRPNFLSYRGETSFERSKSQPYPTVYLDGIEFGPIGSLRTISATEVSSIRLYRSWEATTMFGTGHMGGVIAIYTRR